MDEIALLDLLRSDGWQVKKDDAGDSFCLKVEDENLVQILPAIRERIDHFRVSFSPSVSTKEYSAVISSITQNHNEFIPIIVSNLPVQKYQKLNAEILLKLSREAYLWAKGQNIVAGLQRYAELPTNSKGANPLRHLGALALMGEANKLYDYLASYSRGDRLGFVNYISKEMIERAYNIANSNSKRSEN